MTSLSLPQTRRGALLIGCSFLTLVACGGPLPDDAPSAARAQAVSAAAGKYNLCYEDSDNVWSWSNPSIASHCMEQWGSFPSSCGGAPNGSNAKNYVASAQCSGQGRIRSGSGRHWWVRCMKTRTTSCR